MTTNENDIHVEVDVPAQDEPETEAPEAPSVVVVEAPAADPAPDGLLPVLLDIQARLTRLEDTTVQVAAVAVEAQASADEALANDSAVIEEVLAVQEAVAEAAEEDQAPAESDEAPHKSHWLHR